MTLRTDRSTDRPRARLAALLALAMMVGACGGSSTDSSSQATDEIGVVTSDPTPVVTPTPAPADPAPTPTATPAPAPTPTPTPTSTPSGSSFSWTKPAGFDAALQAAIENQPAYMGGYGGQVANPFPRLQGTAQFPGVQATRADAITLDQYFGRWAYRFSVDSASRHSNGLRAEFTGGGAFDYGAGDAFQYEFDVYFDADYKNSTWTEWNMFAQFHSQGFAAWGLHTAGGYLMMGPPGVASDSLRVKMPARGAWHHFVWQVRWSPDASGHAKLVIDGSTAFDYSGPTMHAGETSYYPKFGSYLANNPYTQVTYSTPWVITAM